MGPPLRRVPGSIVLILWVSACAFAPEIIWQGGLLLAGHFGAAELYTAVFIGAVFTMFVEPLAERLKAGSWRLTHGHEQRRSIVFNAMLSLSVGCVLVCVHESIAAFFGGGHPGDGTKWPGLIHAINQALEWASVPASISAAWLAAAMSRRLGIMATAAACVWTVAAGLLWSWSWMELVLTATVGCVVALVGTRQVLRGWTARSLPALASIVGLVALVFIVSALLLQAAVGWAWDRAELYTMSQVFEDVRFYGGWMLGLLLAPDPLQEKVPAAGGVP